MKNTGTLRIQTFAARQSAPMEGVTVAVQGDGFTLHCITDATGSAADIPVEAPACTLSLDEDNTIRPYAVVSLTAAKSGYRTVRIEGIQIFAGQITLAQPAMIPVTEEGKDIPNAPIIIPPHALFAGSGGSGPQPRENCTPRVLEQVIIPKNITALTLQKPVTEKIITVSGDDILPPNNYKVPIGLPVSSLLHDSGYTSPETVIVGGIVDGRQITDLDEPITSSTNSIIAFNDKSNIPKYRKELI